jgi:hypothetical protein
MIVRSLQFTVKVRCKLRIFDLLRTCERWTVQEAQDVN